MTPRTALAVATALTLLLTAALAEAKHKPWIDYKAQKFGFSMKVPEGTKFTDKDWKNGWGGLYANYWGVQLWGLAHLGKKHTVAQIELFGMLVTGIPARKWSEVEKGKKKNGFSWYKVTRAQKGKHVVFALYGVGPKGSYLLVLKTSKKSFARDKDAYLRWYRSIKAF